MGYIYKITNNLNGMMYVGLTTKARPTDRFSQHRYLARHPEQETNGTASYLHRAMNYYGVDNFSFEVIEEVENELLEEREKYWTTFYNCKMPNGYSLTEGGRGTPGYSRIQTEEEKLKRSESNKKFFEEHPEAKEQIRERTKKLWEDEEYRKKVTESNKKFYAEHPDMFKGENNPFYGKHHTEESLQKIKEASKSRQKKIAQLDKETLEIIKIYDGVKDAEKDLGVSHGWLSKAARADKIAYGFRWKFI
jgi:group I intron endonuclease